MDTQQVPVVDNYTTTPVRQPGFTQPRPSTPPNGYYQPQQAQPRQSGPQQRVQPFVQQPVAQPPVSPVQPPVPPVMPETAKFQMRLTALRAAKDYLMERSYQDNAERLAAEVDLAKFYLGED
jgi:hypothetical protein